MAISNKYYFAYASLLLSDRMSCCARDAEKVAVGSVKGYRLGFGEMSPNWHGGTAVAVTAPDDVMWGVVWKLSQADIEAMLKQESVGQGVYITKELEVEGANGNKYDCFFITMATPPETETQPSPQYKKVITDGAKESGLPRHYIEKLSEIKDNGYNGLIDFKTIKTHY